METSDDHEVQEVQLAHDESSSPPSHQLPMNDARHDIPQASQDSSLSQDDGSSTPPATHEIDSEEIPGTSQDIGPYARAAGISQKTFSEDKPDFHIQASIKNGLVVELQSYLTSMTGPKFAETLISMTGTEGVNKMAVNTYVRRVINQHNKLKRKGKKYASDLNDFLEDEFLLVRSRKRQAPDTPRKQKLRQELAKAKAGSKKIKRQLHDSKSQLTDLESKVEFLEEASAGKKDSVAEVQHLSSNLKELQDQHQLLLKEMEKMTAQFNPAVHEVEEYKDKYNEASNRLTIIEGKWRTSQATLQRYQTRNISRKIRRRDQNINKLQKEKAMLLKEKSTLQDAVNGLKDDLETTQAQLSYATNMCQELKTKEQTRSKKTEKLQKKVWYEKKKKSQTSDSSQIKDILLLDERSKFLEQRNKELEELIVLLEDKEVSTFQDGRYTDSVRRTIMELLSQNVSMNKVNTVIKTVLKNLAGMEVERLPSAGTRSKLALEANHLANIEVALAMKSHTPEDTLGNCIHGDGTTKHHRKYQNFQVSLPDGSSRTMALVEMARGDTEAVVDAFTDHIQELAYTLTTLDEEGTSTELYNKLITTIKSTMTDQGPTMPQFNDKLQSIRAELLPQVVDNWEKLPDDVKGCMLEFGSFFCKMHPLINFAEEVGKVLKAFEDISKSGKNAHTFQTSEAGVTRLIRISSKAFHHRGCDKSGVEDVFTAYLVNAFDVKNFLVDYIGNRANILFEGAAALFFHLDHILSFLSMLDNKNHLLLAVEEDANEKIFKAELRALGLFYGLVTEPLWETVKQSDNILAMNEPLHQLQCKLSEWKEDATPMLSGESPFANVDISSDVVCQKLLVPTDAESESMTIQALELTCCAVLLILQRQCKDQLPGGKYWDPSEKVKSSFSNVPSTNLIGERDFAQLDMLVRQKPAARVTTLETIIMWTNNKTPEWLNGISEEERTHYMKVARQRSSEVLDRYNDRKNKIKAQKWQSLQNSQQKKRESEEKKMNATAALVNEIVALDGLWTTEDSVKQHINKLEKKRHTEEVIRRAIHTQLSFMQKVLKCKGPSKEHYQLTHQQQPFPKDTMVQHLLEVLVHNNLQAESDPNKLVISQPQETSGLQYAQEEERSVSFEEQKANMIIKIDGEKKKRSAQSSKLYIQKLMDNPALLIGCNIEQLFVVDQHKMWVKGEVTGISSRKPDPLKTVFTVDYEDEDELKKYNLLSDLKKNDLIIHSDL